MHSNLMWCFFFIQIDGDFDDYRNEVLKILGEVVFNPSVVANAAVLQ